MEAGRRCENPLCGCGGCKDPEFPDRDCQFEICGCGFCEEEDEFEDEYDD